MKFSCINGFEYKLQDIKIFLNIFIMGFYNLAVQSTLKKDV